MNATRDAAKTRVSKKAVDKNALVYLCSTAVAKAIPFGILPLIANTLANDDFGRLSLSLSMISIFTVVIGMSVQAIVTKKYFSLPKKEVSLIAWNAITIVLLIGLTISILIFMISFFTRNIFSIPVSTIILIPAISFCVTVVNIQLAYFRNKCMATHFATLEIVIAVLVGSMTLFLIFALEVGWRSQLYATLFVNVLISIICLLRMLRVGELAPKISTAKIGEVIAFCYPLVPHAIAVLIVGISDRFFIEVYHGLEELSIYALAYSLGTILPVLSDAYLRAWFPWFYNAILSKDDDVKRAIVKAVYKYLASTVVVGIFLYVSLMYLFPIFFEDRYLKGISILGPIIFAFVVHCYYKIFFGFLVHLSATKVLAICSGIAAILNFVFNFLFIPQFGTYGAALSTACSFCVSACCVFLYQKRHLDLPWRLR
jgi:O-antigen/teichoic acid export membrane protein